MWVLYNLFVLPLELIITYVMVSVNSLYDSKGIAIIAVSLIVNIILNPIFKLSEQMQEEERAKQESMKHWVSHIRKHFKGDIQMMMLSTYYRQQNYNPLKVVKIALPIAIQIPIFMAAYNVLSNPERLGRGHFLMFNSLAKADGLIQLGTVTFNLLPILMTLINIISCKIYCKGMKLKDTWQMYALAVIFLVLLYDKPAGLVLYWTCNNIISLVRNIIYRYAKNKKLIGGIISFSIGMIIMEFSFVNGTIRNTRIALFFAAMLVVSALPLIDCSIKHKENNKISKDGVKEIVLSCILLTVLLGVLIPSTVISSDTLEFGRNFKETMYLIVFSFTVMFGLMMVWVMPTCIYLAKQNSKIYGIVWMTTITLIVNFGLFGKYGSLSGNMTFMEDAESIYNSEILRNSIVLIVSFILAYIIYRYKHRVVKFTCNVLIAGCIVTSVINIFNIKNDISSYLNSMASKHEKVIKLSKTGNNVFVLMLDKYTSALLPFVFDEIEGLQEKFAGFTYYPNTISHGNYTVYGSKEVFGGYEYTADKIDSRFDKKVGEEHDEALRVMPQIFSDNGYNVIFCDPSLPNSSGKYEGSTDILNGIDNSKVYMLRGVFSENDDLKNTNIQRDGLIYYSLFRIVPSICKGSLHNWWANEQNTGVVKANYSRDFTDDFNTLCNLPNVTEIVDDGNYALLMVNETSHAVNLLDKETYSKVDYNDNSSYLAELPIKRTVDGKSLTLDTAESLKKYCTCVAALIKTGEYLDFLREQGVYDNTKIIIVSDHGGNVGKIEGFDVDEYNPMVLNPLLMVKDIDSKEYKVSNEFMSCADTPCLAFDGIVDNPINKATGNEIKSERTETQIVRFARSSAHNVDHYQLDDGSYDNYKVKDNIFDISNWEKIENIK